MKKIVTNFFNLIEKIYRIKNNWKLIPDSETGYIFVDILTYKGKSMKLSDGTIIQKGDIVAEIHANNKKMAELNSRTVIRAFAQEMKLLAKAMEENEDFIKIQAIFGRTALYLLPQRIGFEIFEIKGFFIKRFLRIWDSLIKLVFSSSKRGKTILKEPKEIWLSRKKLIDKLGDK